MDEMEKLCKSEGNIGKYGTWRYGEWPSAERILVKQYVWDCFLPISFNITKTKQQEIDDKKNELISMFEVLKNHIDNEIQRLKGDK
jgi:hypothetical protein